MSIGALIFAFNNEATDYVAMAQWSAQRIQHYLDLPTAVVTDCPEKFCNSQSVCKVIQSQPQTGGHRWFEDYNQSVSWHNAGRTDAFELSPWDYTLVLDADYVVNSRDLRKIIDVGADFLCFKNAYDISDPDKAWMLGFGRFNMPMHWATVMAFRKSSVADWIFQSMSMVKSNWQHYRDLYGIHEPNYRNDYALSIALALVNGGTAQVAGIPWSMATVLPHHGLALKEHSGTEIWEVRYKDQQGKPRSLGWSGMDFHAMGKKDLGDIIASRTGLPHSCS